MQTRMRIKETSVGSLRIIMHHTKLKSRAERVYSHRMGRTRPVPDSSLSTVIEIVNRVRRRRSRASQADQRSQARRKRYVRTEPNAYSRRRMY